MTLPELRIADNRHTASAAAGGGADARLSGRKPSGALERPGPHVLRSRCRAELSRFPSSPGNERAPARPPRPGRWGQRRPIDSRLKG